MKTAPGYYSVIQYCPDLSRAEAANVGVLLFSPVLDLLDVRMSKGNDRARRFFQEKVDTRRLEVAKRAFASSLRLGGLKTLEDLNAFIETRANEFRLVAPRPIKVRANASAQLNELFEELVGGRSRRDFEQTVLREIESRLSEVFHHPLVSNHVRFNEEVTVPIVGRRLRIPFAYTNGKTHLVLPTVFPESSERATNTAMTLAMEGDLLHRDDERRFLVVVAGTETPARTDRLQHLGPLFEHYGSRLVLQGELDSYADEVLTQASS